MHEPVFLERMHAARFGFSRLEEAQRLRDRHWNTRVWPS